MPVIIYYQAIYFSLKENILDWELTHTSIITGTLIRISLTDTTPITAEEIARLVTGRRTRFSTITPTWLKNTGRWIGWPACNRAARLSSSHPCRSSTTARTRTLSRETCRRWWWTSAVALKNATGRKSTVEKDRRALPCKKKRQRNDRGIVNASPDSVRQIGSETVRIPRDRLALEMRNRWTGSRSSAVRIFKRAALERWSARGWFPKNTRG